MNNETDLKDIYLMTLRKEIRLLSNIYFIVLIAVLMEIGNYVLMLQFTFQTLIATRPGPGLNSLVLKMRTIDKWMGTE